VLDDQWAGCWACLTAVLKEDSKGKQMADLMGGQSVALKDEKLVALWGVTSAEQKVSVLVASTACLKAVWMEKKREDHSADNLVVMSDIDLVSHLAQVSAVLKGLHSEPQWVLELVRRLELR